MAEFITSANQRKVKIWKMEKKTGYTKVDIETNKTAQAVLRPSAYKLYMYFAVNKTGHDRIISQVVLNKALAMSRNTYYAAFNELLEKGYLALRPGYACLYNFFENPDLIDEAALNSAEKTKNSVPVPGTEDTKNGDNPGQNLVENTLNTKDILSGEASSLSCEDRIKASAPNVRQPINKNKKGIFYNM